MPVNRRFCIAPMMDWSDRHCRHFWRLLTGRAVLYTEMVTTAALVHGDRARLLEFGAAEHPLALQLGGSEPDDLARCAAWAERWGYDEVNLNCGCPSGRVQSGQFGACLMAQPRRVAACVKAMRAACALPVTVKHRIGIDHQEHYADMLHFVDTVAAAGCSTFIVHARKAWLQGLSPKENRDLPPLHYDWVYRLKQERPELEIIINGGIDSLAACQRHLRQVDGVMLGRAAYLNPYMLAGVDREIFGDTVGASHASTAKSYIAGDTSADPAAAPADIAGDSTGNISADPAAPLTAPAKPPSRDQVIARLLPYIEAQLARGARLNHITRHILGLYQGVPGARRFRRHLSEHANRPGATAAVLRQALLSMQPTEEPEPERMAL